MNQVTITPLGTVSPYCKGEYNCPGFLVSYNDKKILLDCGNGITRLLNMPDDLQNLNVFVSHLHKDHIGDLGSIQYASYVYNNIGMLNKEVNIYLPQIEICNQIINTQESFARYHEINEQIEYVIDEIKVSFHNNNSHTIPSYVVKLESDWFKIVYTSDIGNINLGHLANFSSKADLLICESSFIKENNINSNTHLHAHEAGELAAKAEVKKLMLTHFWPEESKAEYLKEAKEVFENTIVAEEGKQLVLRRK